MSKENIVVEEHERDLPLSSNFPNIQVEHFVLNLSCSPTSKIFDCSMTLFCKMSNSTNPEENENKVTLNNAEDSRSLVLLTSEQMKIKELDAKSRKFFVCLDCFALDISSCSLNTSTSSDWESLTTNAHDLAQDTSLKISQIYMSRYYEMYERLQGSQEYNSLQLEYHVSKHCLTIFLPPNVDSRHQVVLKICYKTRIDGPSLMSTVDQCGRPCVFTIGHLLNNRSLFPCQDLPQAMSTWHCTVTLTNPHNDQVSVVMTGEAEPEISFNKNSQKVFTFCNSYPMPAATFALAVGTWSVTDIINLSSLDSLDPDRCIMPRCRLFSPESLHEQSVDQLRMYLPLSFEVMNSVLGPYPLKHLDLLIVPECFDSLGLACPHLLLLSQSILSPDLSMLYRLSHELCHTWFGILTGPRDWTEEWLTEGVCCYLEDIIHAAVMKWNSDESHNWSVLRALLKFRILSSELGQTSEDLQTLRPNVGRVTNQEEGNDAHMFVRNGLNHEKTVMQVHYLKGFFLLRYLEGIAGRKVFLQTLRSFTAAHLGRLFSSKEFLDYIFENCCNLRESGLTVAKVCDDWLDCPGKPYHLNSFSDAIECSLVTQVKNQVAVIKEAVSRKRVRGQRSQNTDIGIVHSVKFLPEQLTLMFEILVEEDVPVTAGQLQILRDTYNIDEANAEVKHSWCELVIHRKAVRWMKDIENFLVHHQALGVYLYGELLISQNKLLKILAYNCYNKLQVDMPEGPKTIVQDMLFPS